MSSTQTDRDLVRRHRAVAAACGVFVAAMIGAAYAAVPLYDWFCRTTGFAGTPRIASAASKTTSETRIRIRFDANVAAGLNWEFAPEQRTIEARIGETILVHYVARNRGSQESLGTASYNVSPPQAGAYFNKLECFCFSEQRLKPGERLEMPVAFFIDPELVKDGQAAGISTITLSYTFFPLRKAPSPVATMSEGANTAR